MTLRPTMFIGSASASLPAAHALQARLEHVVEITVWDQGFPPGTHFLEALVDSAQRFDFATRIADGVDTLQLEESVGTLAAVPRDNVVFELGLFIGALGRDRTFLVTNRNKPPKLPSDLAGVVRLEYREHIDGNLEAALQPTASKLQRRIEELGRRETHRIEKMEAQVEHMVRLLARSRRLELEVVAKQFGSLIRPALLDQLLQDLKDLGDSLGDGDWESR